MPRSDLTGQRFNRLVAIKKAGRARDGHTLWYCRCDCGEFTVVPINNLRPDHTTSCGCYQREQIGLRSRTHGMTNTPEYRTWQHMLSRCYNPNFHQWKDYGGRGIAVCDRWRNSFENFLKDMGARPPGKSIDRYPNKHGNYEPGNVRWATRKEQANNRRKQPPSIWFDMFDKL